MDQNAEDEEHKWLKKLTFSVKPRLFNYPIVHIRGISQTTGEFVLASYDYPSYDVFVVLYNHYTDCFRKVKVQGKYEVKRDLPTGIFVSDYVESVRLL